MRRTATRGLAVLAALTLVLGACGEDDADVEAVPPTTAAEVTAAEPETTAETTTAEPATTAEPTTTAEAPPTSAEAEDLRIVSMSATATEMLFGIGAGDQVVAVDSTSNYPPEAPTTDLSAFEPSAEAISTYEPDVVILGFPNEDLTANLGTLGIDTLVLPAVDDLDGVYDQIAEVGVLTGEIDGAARLVADMRADLEALVAEAPGGEGLTYFHELDENLFTATSSTFVGDVYALFGLENVADPASGPDDGGYPQLSAEYLIDAAPDLIFLADTVCCGQSAETVAARPGWDTIPAVETGAVVPLDDDVASRWGPRLVDLAETVSAALREREPVG